MSEMLTNRILDTALLTETYGFTVFIFSNPLKLLKSLHSLDLILHLLPFL